MRRSLALAIVVCAIADRVHAGPAEDLDAARVAERAGDISGAIRLLERVVDTSPDELTRTRARADIARLTPRATPIANEQARLAEQIRRGGDPRKALRALEALVRANPTFGDATSAMLVLAEGWEREGETERALDWLREATADGDARARAELARVLIRARRFREARAVITTITDRALAASLRERIVTAERRGLVRWGVLAILVAIIVITAIALWRFGWRRLRRVPVEVLYYAPIATLLALVAQTGNPLVARAVQLIALGGFVVAWVCGTLLEARRRAHYVVGAVVAMLCIGYLVMDQQHLIDLLLETWRSGPAMR